MSEQFPVASPSQSFYASAGKRAGRSHRARGEPCQDAFALWTDAASGRAVAAVADGLGSRPLSQHGSQAACDAAVASLRGEASFDRDAVVRAFAAARAAVAAEAQARGLPPEALATTLQLAAVADGRVVAAMVGDGAVVAGSPAAVLLAPRAGGYANEVVPLTADDWLDLLQFAEAASTGPVLLFSDGLTRLLLARERGGHWTPFAPFFETFLPQVAAAADDGLAQRFLDMDDVDRRWDDDKCLVVLHAR